MIILCGFIITSDTVHIISLCMVISSTVNVKVFISGALKPVLGGGSCMYLLCFCYFCLLCIP